METIFLQASTSTVIIVAIFVAVIISVIFFAIQKKSISSIKNQITTLHDPKIKYDVERIEKDLGSFSENLTNLRTSMPHTAEVSTMQENVTKLCSDFSELKTTLDSQMDMFRLNTTEDLTKTKEEMIKNATEEITELAGNHIKENSVDREEFNNLKQRIEKLVGTDDSSERVNLLATLFDSLQIKVLNWQCGMFKLLRGGLAPEAEEDHMVAKGIPLTPGIKFLKKLDEQGIVDLKKVNAYYLNPEYEWIYSYIDNPDWLQKKLEDKVKKEKDYQQFIKNHLNLIEEGLLLEESEYQLATGKIDFVCRDSSGKMVGLELKYPVAATTVNRQLLGYKADYERKTGNTNTRFMIIAPKLSDNLKELLTQEKLEFKEINFE